MRSFKAFILGALTLVPALAWSGVQEEIETLRYKYAPKTWLGVSRSWNIVATGKDKYPQATFALPLAMDADGDVKGDNNLEWILQQDLEKLQPKMYSDILITDTHYYVRYFSHFPAQGGGIPHENDNNAIFLVVDRKKELANPSANNVVAVALTDHNEFQWTSVKGQFLPEKPTNYSVDGFTHKSTQLVGTVVKAKSPLVFEGTHIVINTNAEHHIHHGKLTKDFIVLEVSSTKPAYATFSFDSGMGSAVASLGDVFHDVWPLRDNPDAFQNKDGSDWAWFDYTLCDKKCLNAKNCGLREASSDGRPPWVVVGKCAGWLWIDEERRGNYTDPANSPSFRKALVLFGTADAAIGKTYLYNPYHGIGQ